MRVPCLFGRNANVNLGLEVPKYKVNQAKTLRLCAHQPSKHALRAGARKISRSWPDSPCAGPFSFSFDLPQEGTLLTNHGMYVGSRYINMVNSYRFPTEMRPKCVPRFDTHTHTTKRSTCASGLAGLCSEKPNVQLQPRPL